MPLAPALPLIGGWRKQMAQIIDLNGNPIVSEQLEDTQTARLGHLQSEWENHPTRGLTPPKLAHILQLAEQGDITAQHEMFADMEEKDAHLYSVLQTRRLAISQLDWSVAEPEHATAEEKNEAALVREALQCLELEDVLFDMTDAIGHGFAALELQWGQVERMRLPLAATFRPQGWFKTPVHTGGTGGVPGLDRNELRLRDNSADGEALWPLGWILHTHRSRSGYLARTGLFRVLAWPWLFKNFAVRDLAEFLEIYGLPLRLGTYNPNNADDKARATLMRAVVGIGHDAAAIIPEGMQIEFKEAAKGDNLPFDAMVGLMERSMSKAVLGGTLTSGEGEHGTQALGNVHNELRHDLAKSDARQLASTLTRQLIYPLLAVNRGRSSLQRCPRLVLDCQEPHDLSRMAESLPKLVDMGMRIKLDWAHEKLKIPRAADGDAVLQPSVQAQPGLAALAQKKNPGGRLDTLKAQRTAQRPSPAAGSAETAEADALDTLTEAMLDEWQAESDPLQQAVLQALKASSSLAEFRAAVEQRVAEVDPGELADLIGRGAFVARLWGNLHANRQS
jgi:phage gp29-like protein